MSVFTIALLNIVIWPVTHVAVSWWALRLKPESFNSTSFLYRERFWEFRGALYEKFFLIKRWKGLLPDGAGMLGVKIARDMSSLLKSSGQKKLYVETMRSEWAHWVTMLVGLLLSSFNTFQVWLIMLAYAFIANLPCILAQRYNRIKIKKVLAKHQVS